MADVKWAKVKYVNEGVEIEVPVGTTILQASQEAGMPEGSACGGVCACSTCHVYVQKGASLLSEAEDDEEDILEKAFDVRSGSRLGCQARIEKPGEIEIAISRESYEAYYAEHPEARKALEEAGRAPAGLSSAADD